MAKVWGQAVPPTIHNWYTRILGLQRSTGWNYWEGFYGYGYGGLVGKRIPFRMRRWQDKYGKKISTKRKKQRKFFQRAVWTWWNQPYAYGAEWGQAGPISKTTWAEKAHQVFWQYFQYFMYYSLTGIIRGEVLDWQKLDTFGDNVFDDSSFV